MKKNMRRLTLRVTAQTLYNLERLRQMGHPVLVVRVRLPTCRLSSFPTFRLVGKSESRRLGDLAG